MDRVSRSSLNNPKNFQNKAKLGNILLSSFKGRSRHIYQDEMAIVREYGKPDLFRTMAFNTAWPELKRALSNFKHNKMESYDWNHTILPYLNCKIN